MQMFCKRCYGQKGQSSSEARNPLEEGVMERQIYKFGVVKVSWIINVPVGSLSYTWPWFPSSWAGSHAKSSILRMRSMTSSASIMVYVVSPRWRMIQDVKVVVQGFWQLYQRQRGRFVMSPTEQLLSREEVVGGLIHSRNTWRGLHFRARSSKKFLDHLELLDQCTTIEYSCITQFLLTASSRPVISYS